jgi:hypothetical protein
VLTQRPPPPGQRRTDTINHHTQGTEPVDINSAFPSKYLSAEGDIPEGRDLNLTISDVKMERVGQGRDAEDKPVVYFDEVKKGLTLNVTNKNTIIGLYGKETDDWIGKRIALFATEVEFKGEQVLGIRVRIKAPKAKPVPVGPPPADDDDMPDF